ncbi:MAG: ABC transporter ATP-binding protein [Thermoplasmata archaeon]
MKNMIYAEGVHKYYDAGEVKVHALRGLNLSVKDGEMVGIIGPSGAGKTTLMNCLSGLDTISKGKVWVDGKNYVTMSDKDKTRMRAQKMGFIFQFYNLLPVLTAVENVEIPLLLSGKSKDSRSRAEKALNIVGLGHRYDHRPSALSGGERQRVTIARAIVNEPDIIWADEPTGDLDSVTSERILDILVKLNEMIGHTMVLITHEKDIAERANRILYMENGVIQKRLK